MTLDLIQSLIDRLAPPWARVPLVGVSGCHQIFVDGTSLESFLFGIQTYNTNRANDEGFRLVRLNSKQKRTNPQKEAYSLFWSHLLCLAK